MPGAFDDHTHNLVHNYEHTSDVWYCLTEVLMDSYNDRPADVLLD